MNNIINITATTEENFARALNITAQREIEIDEILDNCYELTDTYPDALAAASHKLQNTNELAYASFHLGAFAESRRSKYELLHKLIGE
jgi:hypothetical protein